MAELGTRLTIRAVDDGLVLEGEIDGDTVADFDRALAERLAADRFVRLDMQGVTSLDAAALRVLVAATGRSRSRDGDIVLDGTSAAVTSVVQSSGLAWLLTSINAAPSSIVSATPLD